MARIHVLRQLERRHVLRAALLYASAVWALSQGFAQLAPYMGAPDWAVRWFLAAAVVGFPFWIAFAWFYRLTPAGLQRESEVDPADAQQSHRIGRKLDYWIIGILAVAVVLLVTNTFVLRRDATSLAESTDAQAIAAALAEVPQKSVAVLPLVNDSGDKDQVYFSDGLSEDLINALSQFPGLKVIARNSSFRFRDTKEDPGTIGAKLGVAHLLEGSVQHAGDSVRITVQLVNAADGSTLWSQHYDRPFKDLFALQDEITRAAAGALKVRLLRGAAAAAQGYRPASGNLAAYTSFLQAIEYRYAANGEAGWLRVISALAPAIRRDPNYAQAYAVEAVMWMNVADDRTGRGRLQAITEARAATEAAVKLGSDTAVVLNAVGNTHAYADHDWAKAEADYRRAIQLDPNYFAPRLNLAELFSILGRPAAAVKVARNALATDPLQPLIYHELAYALIALGQLDEAEQATRKIAELQPSWAMRIHTDLTTIEILRGHDKAALAEARRTSYDVRGAMVALALQIGGDRVAADVALKTLIAKPAPSLWHYKIARVYALRKDPDEVFAWLDRAVASHEPVAAFGAGGLLSDPFFMPYQRDPRFAAIAHKVGLPMPGERPTDVKATRVANGAP